MTAQLAPAPVFSSRDNLGFPLVGGQLFTYAAGTTTPQATYVDSTQTTPNTNPVILNFRGEAFVWTNPLQTYKFVLQDLFGNLIWTEDNIPGGAFISSSGTLPIGVSLLPTPTNTLTLGSAAFSWANLYLGPNSAAVLDPVSGNIGYYARTPAEIAAGVTPVNYSIEPAGYPERYGTNTVPGTTPMTGAVQATINVARKGNGGGVIYIGRSGPYVIDGALDLSTPVGSAYPGFRLCGIGNANPASSNPAAVITLAHNAIAFDCTGTFGITFENLSIQALNGVTYPTICFLLARNTSGASQTMRFNNVQVLGNFSKAILYNYGSEDDQYTACGFYNRASDANSVVGYFTSTNILGIVSTFSTIAAGAQSTIDHKIIGGEFAHEGGVATQDVFRFDAVSNVKIFGPWMLCASGSANGRSLIYMHTVNGPTNQVTLVGVEGEHATNLQQYGIFFDGTSSATPSYWVIESCTFPNVTAAIVANTNVTCDDFHIKALSNQSTGGGINIAGKLQNSHIDELGLGGVAIQIGTSQNNIYNVNQAALAITSALGGDYHANVTVPTWTPVTSSFSITGTLTVSHAVYQRLGSTVEISVTLSATTSLSCAAGATIGGLPLGATNNGIAWIYSLNAGVPTQIGMGLPGVSTITLPAISVGANVPVIINARYFTN